LGFGAVGASIGAFTAPKDEARSGHALLWGGLSAAAGFAAGSFLFDEQKRSDELDRQVGVLKKSLSALSGEGDEPKPILESSSVFSKDLPAEYKGLIRPGRWSIYQINQWVVNGENTLVHQDKMIRLLQPELFPKLEIKSEKESEK
jgi:hypothetical protein